MINIPTGVFWGAISDVLKAAADARTERDHAYVRVDWTGERLMVSTYAITRGAVCTWNPADEGPSWGGDDEPVSVVLRTGQAKDILDTFKLAAGKAYTPLSLDTSYEEAANEAIGASA